MMWKSNRNLLSVCAGALVMSLLAISAQALGPNLIRNPGLDNGTNTGTSQLYAAIPEWTNINEVMYVSDDGHDAPGCAQIDWSTGKLRQAGIPVTGGQIYTFSYWAKYAPGRWSTFRGTANVFLVYYDAGGTQVGQNNLTLLPPDNGTWVKATAVWTVPAAAVEARIWSAGVGGATDAVTRVDDFSLNLGYGLVTVNGQVSLDNYTGSRQDVCAKIVFSQGGTAKRTDRVILTDNGTFTLQNVEVGTYDIGIKAYASLETVQSGINLTNHPTNLDPIYLANGDTDGDNSVTSSDLAIILANLE